MAWVVPSTSKEGRLSYRRLQATCVGSTKARSLAVALDLGEIRSRETHRSVLHKGWMTGLVGTGLCRHLNNQREVLQLRNARSRDRGGPCLPIPLQSFLQLFQGGFKLVASGYCVLGFCILCFHAADDPVSTDSPDLILYRELPLKVLWKLARDPLLL